MMSLRLRNPTRGAFRGYHDSRTTRFAFSSGASCVSKGRQEPAAPASRTATPPRVSEWRERSRLSVGVFFSTYFLPQTGFLELSRAPPETRHSPLRPGASEAPYFVSVG